MMDTALLRFAGLVLVGTRELSGSPLVEKRSDWAALNMTNERFVQSFKPFKRFSMGS